MTDIEDTKIEAAVSPEESAEVIDDDVQKPVFNKIQMQDVVNREKQKAFERGKREAMMELQQNQQQPDPQQAGQIQQQSQGLGGMQQMSEQDIERMIMQKAPEALMHQINEMKSKNMIDSFVNKMQAAEERYPGLEQRLNKLNYEDPRMHKLVEMSNGLENTGDIINELVMNPHKMGQILSNIADQPYLAQEQLMGLSNSIKSNQSAQAENTQSKDPMSQLKPSISAGLADSNNLSVRDIQKLLSKR